MMERICERLSSFGYDALEDDTWTLTFVLEKVEQRICNICNVSQVPHELLWVATDLVVSEFLLAKKATGGEDCFDLSPAVKQVQEGDTSVTYAFGDGSLTPEARLDAALREMARVSEDELTAWRRMKW